MMGLHETGRAVVEGLKGQPLALALVLINVLFLLVGLHMLREIAQSVARKDQLLTQLADRCLLAVPRKE